MSGDSSGTQRPLLDLGDQIIGLAGRLASATCRWLLLVAEFDAREGADAYGLPTTSAWLSHHCGIAARTARDHVRVARALAHFPVLAGSMSAGRISYSHARAIAGLATPGEDAMVHDLVASAEYGTIGQLEALIAGLRTVDREIDDPVDPHPPVGESLAFRDRSDARVGLSARLDPEHGAVVRAAIDAVIAADGADSADRADGAEHESMSPAGAMVRMAELVLALLAERGQDLPTRREDADTTIVLHLHAVPAPARPAAGDGAAAAGSPDWTLVPEAALAAARIQDRSGSAEPPSSTAPSEESVPCVALGRLAGHHGGPAGAAGLPGHVIERLACSARVQLVMHGSDGNVLDLGRTRRFATDAQVQALLIRQHGRCGHPGCQRRHNLHAHHVIAWQHGGLTDLDNLILLCEYHHAALHRGEFVIHRHGRQRFTFTHHDRALLAHVDPSRSITTTEPLEREHPVAIDAADNRWDGTRMNLSYATSCFAVPRYQERDRRRAMSAAA